MAWGLRPDHASDMVELSTKITKTKIFDLFRAIKCIKQLKYEKTSNIVFRSKSDKWRIIVLTAASNLKLIT